MPSETASVGCEVLDAQHGAIATLLERVRQRVEANDPDGTARTVNALWDEVVNHFTTEEALMERFAYPELPAHRAAHQLFLEDLRSLSADLRAEGLTAEVATWACRRLPDWVTFHVETNDVPLGRFLARRMGARPTPSGPPGGPPGRPKRSDA
ncbi:MAG TPA: hemerythrin family protein [Anaeromyxobacteraceae bacterium]|nr:hemerythrin family protein [Anaeromyxobacteraceae bacterium]